MYHCLGTNTFSFGTGVTISGTDKSSLLATNEFSFGTRTMIFGTNKFSFGTWYWYSLFAFLLLHMAIKVEDERVGQTVPSARVV